MKSRRGDTFNDTGGGRGRPRGFDVDVALDRALNVFWRKGYEGASLDDLTAAMGINRPSLYAAFGNKEELFRKVLERYAQGPAAHACKAMQAPTARAVAELMLLGTVELLTAPGHPRGCLAVQSALAGGETSECIRRELIAHREAGVAALRKRFQRARREGDLPRNADPAHLARYIATIAHGLAVQAASGATRTELIRVVKTALRALEPDLQSPAPSRLR
jgi:AcrR family transcriptional regulator